MLDVVSKMKTALNTKLLKVNEVKCAKTFRRVIKVKNSFTIGLTLFPFNKESHKHQRTSRKIWLTLYTNKQKHPIFSFLAFLFIFFLSSMTT